jgi:dipeptidyl-peptidase 9
MDTPQNNPVGYKLGSVINYVDNFPDEENRLLIVHGLKDENGLFLITKKILNSSSFLPYDNVDRCIDSARKTIPIIVCDAMRF